VTYCNWKIGISVSEKYAFAILRVFIGYSPGRHILDTKRCKNVKYYNFKDCFFVIFFSIIRHFLQDTINAICGRHICPSVFDLFLDRAFDKFNTDVIAQQYSSSIFITLLFHCPKEKLGVVCNHVFGDVTRISLVDTVNVSV
jgi:hypothetical protein